jgi:hypothetical protein
VVKGKGRFPPHESLGYSQLEVVEVEPEQLGCCGRVIHGVSSFFGKPYEERLQTTEIEIIDEDDANDNDLTTQP